MLSENISRLVYSSIVLFCLLSSSQVHAWGGLFNRFNPSMLSNLGYGGAGGGYGKELYSVAKSSGEPNALDEILDEESKAEVSAECSGKMCTANEHCCKGHVCVDNDETTGTCLPVWGNKMGEYCHRDQDCESSFICVDRTCQSPAPGKLMLGENCRTSSECNVGKGLCCKLQRRARSQPTKICSYFVDPANCLGPVAARPVTGRDFTAGEKRIASHPDYIRY